MNSIRIYGTIGDFEGPSAQLVADAIEGGGADDDLEVRINSAGGLVSEGMAIYSRLIQHKGKKTVIIDGMAASMASLIAMAGDEILISEAGLIMIHHPMNIMMGNAEELRKGASDLDVMAEAVANIYAKRTGKPYDEIWQMMSDETYMNAEDAIEMGFATSVLSAGNDEEPQMISMAHLKVKALPEFAATMCISGKRPEILAEQPAVTTQKMDSEMAEPVKKTVPAGDAVVTETATMTSAPDLDAIRMEERKRIQEITRAAMQANISDELRDKLINDNKTVEQAKVSMFEQIAANDSAQPAMRNAHTAQISVQKDGADKMAEGMTAWMIQRSGVAKDVNRHAKIDLDPGEFRGLTMMEMARHCLEANNISTRMMDRSTLAKTALMMNGQSTSNFPVILENTMHKTLQAAYAQQPDTWSRFCRTGTVTDFRPHYRYRMGSLEDIKTVTEDGEFKNIKINDAERNVISAGTKGGIIAITRQTIINDDMNAFMDLSMMLGRAARRTIENDVYALLALNSGLGPTMPDSNPLFDAAHVNIGTGSALGVAGLEADRVLLSQQRDVDSNEYLDLRPAILLVPVGLGGDARTINDMQYDSDSTAASVKPNKVRGLFSDIVDTPRLSGTRRYIFADPTVYPTLEVAFLDGVQEPFLDMQEGWRTDGVEWKVRLDYGVGGVDYRGAVTNAGA